MSINKNLKYVIVDDDPFNNMLCSMVIEDTLGEVDTKTFTEPEEGLAYIENDAKSNTVLFLDINMPTLTGWEFLEQYEKFSEDIKQHTSIYILSSSVDYRDKRKAKDNKYVKGFLSKPLESETIISIANNEFPT